MGRKVHPVGFRLKINKPWSARWFAEGQEYRDQLHQDLAIREKIRKENERAGISAIEIEDVYKRQVVHRSQDRCPYRQKLSVSP